MDIGDSFGAFQILGKLGEGGMGVVYRARDVRLGRDVALKVLPGALASDADRLARFEREARLLATLHHPHVAAIFGVEVVDGVHALVLELVEGPLLSDRIARGPIPVDEAVRIAAQIADALEAAHERGIVHRDLKPGNVKFTPDGRVKVLDFGLARAMTSATDGAGGGAGERSATPVTATAMTQAGMVLGTAAYMAPEQARGQLVDRRADIWSFGCVLFEMLAGRRPFDGPTMTDILAAVLEREPDWRRLPGGIPSHLDWLLRRCLDKDAATRLRDIGEARLALTRPALVPSMTTEPAAPPPGRPARLTWIVVGAMTIVAAIYTALASRGAAPAPPETFPVRFDVTTPVSVPDPASFAVSPDGRHLVFAGTAADGIMRLWVRSLHTVEARPLSGTEGELSSPMPMAAWSPDSRFIAFYAAGKIKRIDRAGGVTEAVCNVPGIAVGGAWNEHGDILVGNTTGGLLRCPAGGGEATPVTRVTGSGPQRFHGFPSFLPGGRRFVYLGVSRGDPSSGGLLVGSLDVAPEQQSSERVLATGLGAAFVPAPNGSGHLLTVRDGTLVALPFDAAAGRVTGDARSIAENVGSFLDAAFFTASGDTVVYRGQAPLYQPAWLDRRGGRLATVGEPGAYSRLALSADATRAIVSRENRSNRAERDLWLIDLARNATTRLTSDAGLESMPTWLTGNTQVVFARGAGRTSDLYRLSVGGGGDAEALAAARGSGLLLNPLASTMSASPDGRFLVVTAEMNTETRYDVWLLPLAPGGSKPVPLVQGPFDQGDGWMSPDGRWVAYVSNESGSNDVFVARLTTNGAEATPVAGERLLVARGGFAPRWRADGRELFFLTTVGAVMASPVSATTVSPPTELFRAPGVLDSWGVASDGQRFLVALPASPAAAGAFSVLLHWQALLVPAR